MFKEKFHRDTGERVVDANLLQKLKDWRKKTAQKESVELYRVLSNKTIEAIATLTPKNQEELMAINGIKEKKFEKYGLDILLIVNGTKGGSLIKEAEDEGKKLYTVSTYLNYLNANLWEHKGRIRGEISSLDIRQNCLYFSIKDKKDESVLNCFIWRHDYELCGIAIEEGMEIIVEGFPEVYKPSGRLSFKVSTIELVGEGVLKLAYDKLKKQLESEGLFTVERKKAVPEFPQKIGLITSETGAVIHDFQSNLGQYGYKIKFVDSRVEGQAAIKDLISAINYFSDKGIDVLVIIRGGGSFESLQAFNNEILVRKIADCKVPVICGIGHDKDIPLASLAADKAVSTPTAVTTILNESWATAIRDIADAKKDLIYKYQELLNNTKYELEDLSNKLEKRFIGIFRHFDELKNKIKQALTGIGYSIKNVKEMLHSYSLLLINGLEKHFSQSKNNIDDIEKKLKIFNPMRQLKLGYSIASTGGRIIKKVEQVKIGDGVSIQVSDGSIKSEVKNIKRR